MAVSFVKSSLMHVDQTLVFALSLERWKRPPSNLMHMFIFSVAGLKACLSKTAKKKKCQMGLGSVHIPA